MLDNANDNDYHLHEIQLNSPLIFLASHFSYQTEVIMACSKEKNKAQSCANCGGCKQRELLIKKINVLHHQHIKDSNNEQQG